MNLLVEVLAGLESQLADSKAEINQLKESANYHGKLGITLLNSKWLDPRCHKGCQSLVIQNDHNEALVRAFVQGVYRSDDSHCERSMKDWTQMDHTELVLSHKSHVALIARLETLIDQWEKQVEKDPTANYTALIFARLANELRAAINPKP